MNRYVYILSIQDYSTGHDAIPKPHSRRIIQSSKDIYTSTAFISLQLTFQRIKQLWEVGCGTGGEDKGELCSHVCDLLCLVHYGLYDKANLRRVALRLLHQCHVVANTIPTSEMSTYILLAMCKRFEGPHNHQYQEWDFYVNC